MFYVFSYTPTVSDTATAPKKLDMKLSAGVIHQVDILFQDGCNHEEFVQIIHGKHQIWPTNPGEKMRGNATVISFREFLEIPTGDSLLSANIWSTLSSGWVEVLIQIGVLPKRIIQPMSFEELLNAASGV